MKKMLKILLCAVLVIVAVIGIDHHLKNGTIDISKTKLVQYLQAGGGPVSGSGLTEWSGNEGVEHPESSMVVYGKDILQTEESELSDMMNLVQIAGGSYVFLYDEEQFDGLAYEATWGKDTLFGNYYFKCEIKASNIYVIIVFDSEKKNEVDLCAMLDEMYPYIVGDEELQ